ALRAGAVDDAEDAAPGCRLRDDHLHRVGGRAVDAADLRERTDRGQHVDRVAVSQEHEEAVSRADGERVPSRQLDQLLVRTAPAHQARTRGFAESQPEGGPGHGRDQRLVQVLHRLDEVRLAQNQVDGLGLLDPDQAPASRPPVRDAAPDRYRIKRQRDGEVLTCIEAPTVTVRIKQGFCVTASAARSFPPGSIFLDGAAQGEPFIDPKRQLYNLDHHEGCVRSFTLATCEQAVVLVRKGLDLRRRDWTVYANDADLDTVLAIWVLLNHIRLNEIDGQTRARIMPLLRLQGAIDAQGLELSDLCGLPPKLLAETQAWIDDLRARELALKRRGRWQSSDLLRHTADRLRAIDRLVYPAKHFDDVAEIDELVRAEIAGGSVAIVCRSTAGIYEVERQLRRLHGRRLGVIALQRDAATYSLRQVDPYLPASLEKVYAHLNLIDPAAGGHRSGNRWAGSADIGGSPR